MPKRLGVASRDRPSRAYGLRHVTIIRESVITKWFPNMGKLSGTSSLCPFEKVIRFLLAQIVLGSDYSPSVKELRRLLQPVLSKASLNKSLKNKKNRKKDKTTLRPFSGSKSRDAFQCWVEKRWNRIARGPERLRTRALAS